MQSGKRGFKNNKSSHFEYTKVKNSVFFLHHPSFIFLIFGSFDVFLLQAGVKIPHTPCAYPLGMENRKIPDSAIVASSRYSTYYGPERGRLNKQGNVNKKKMYMSRTLKGCVLVHY